MSRSKSAGTAVPTAPRLSNEELRAMFRRVAPYIVHQWRTVCEELGVGPEVLDGLLKDYSNARKSELAFQGLCRWQEVAGRATSRDRLLRVVTQLGLRRAEDELRVIGQTKRTVPFMGRPVTAEPSSEMAVNKQAKQKALADRLSRPKSTPSGDQPDTKKAGKTAAVPKHVGPSVNPLTLHMGAAKPSDICEVKLKITFKGIQPIGKDEIEQTRDDFKSTKGDYKHVCHTYVKLVMANRKYHFRKLKQMLGIKGISIQKLTKLGFNINVFILCHNLGAFEMLHQSHTSGRLKNIVNQSLVTDDYLKRLNACQLELLVDVDEGLFNRYRDILLVRESPETTSPHPVDEIDYFRCESDESSDEGEELDKETAKNFDLVTWTDELRSDADLIDKRYKVFSADISDLIMTLRIVRPSDTTQLTCLQELLDYYHYLRKSKSVGSGTRTDLVTEYLAIVNHIRLKVENVGAHDIHICFDENMNAEMLDIFHKLLSQIEHMLDPRFKFEADVNKVVSTHALTGMEQEMFGGLLCYVPRLIQLLFSLCESLIIDADANNSDKADVESISNSNGNADDNKENVHDINGVLIDSGKDKSYFTCDGDVNETFLTRRSSVNYIDTWTPVS